MVAEILIGGVGVGGWLYSLDKFADATKAYFDAKKAGLDLEERRDRVRLVQTQERKELSATEANLAEHLTQIIAPSTLKVLKEDIERAQKRWENRLEEGTLNKSEEQRAVATICKHLRKIRDLNGGQFPQGDYPQTWISFGCQSRETARKAGAKRKASPKTSKKKPAKRSTQKKTISDSTFSPQTQIGRQRPIPDL